LIEARSRRLLTRWDSLAFRSFGLRSSGPHSSGLC
jgi:hypothetical protein